MVQLVLHYKAWIDSETVIMAEREADKNERKLNTGVKLIQKEEKEKKERKSSCLGCK